MPLLTQRHFASDLNTNTIPISSSSQNPLSQSTVRLNFNSMEKPEILKSTQTLNSTLSQNLKVDNHQDTALGTPGEDQNGGAFKILWQAVDEALKEYKESSSKGKSIAGIVHLDDQDLSKVADQIRVRQQSEKKLRGKSKIKEGSSTNTKGGKKLYVPSKPRSRKKSNFNLSSVRKGKKNSIDAMLHKVEGSGTKKKQRGKRFSSSSCEDSGFTSPSGYNSPKHIVLCGTEGGTTPDLSLK